MMSDILEELAQARPAELDRAAPGWAVRREQLLADLDDRVSRQPPGDPASGPRHRRTLLALAAAAAAVVVVIVGAALQSGQRVQPQPARTATAPAADPRRPVHPVGPGEYFLRRTTTTVDAGRGVQAYQRAVWFDDTGTMWSFSIEPGGTTRTGGPFAPGDAANPLSFTRAIGDDPVAAEKLLTARASGVTDSVQEAADANLSALQYRTLQQVLLRQAGARRLADGADTLSRPALVIETPGRMGTVLRFYFDAGTSEILEVRTLRPGGGETELGRSILVGDVRSGEPAPPFDPVVPSATPPAAAQLNRPLAPGQYLRRSVTIEDGAGSSTNGSQWVSSDQRRWLGAPGNVAGPDELPAPAGMSVEQYLAAMPTQVDRIDGWLVDGLDPSCGACLLSRADALMLGNLDATRRQWVIVAIARAEGATEEPITDRLGRPARELRLPAEVDGRTVDHLYRYEPETKELLEWGIHDPDGHPTGVVWLTFLGSEVTDQPPG